jgi:hypothetical protein
MQAVTTKVIVSMQALVYLSQGAESVNRNTDEETRVIRFEI